MTYPRKSGKLADAMLDRTPVSRDLRETANRQPVIEGKWLSHETARFLRVAEQTLANWRWRGCGPPFLKINGAVRYDPQVVREWAASQTQTSTSESQHLATSDRGE